MSLFATLPTLDVRLVVHPLADYVRPLLAGQRHQDGDATTRLHALLQQAADAIIEGRDEHFAHLQIELTSADADAIRDAVVKVQNALVADDVTALTDAFFILNSAAVTLTALRPFTTDNAARADVDSIVASFAESVNDTSTNVPSLHSADALDVSAVVNAARRRLTQHFVGELTRVGSGDVTRTIAILRRIAHTATLKTISAVFIERFNAETTANDVETLSAQLIRRMPHAFSILQNVFLPLTTRIELHAILTAIFIDPMSVAVDGAVRAGVSHTVIRTALQTFTAQLRLRFDPFLLPAVNMFAMSEVITQQIRSALATARTTDELIGVYENVLSIHLTQAQTYEAAFAHAILPLIRQTTLQIIRNAVAIKPTAPPDTLRASLARINSLIALRSVVVASQRTWIINTNADAPQTDAITDDVPHPLAVTALSYRSATNRIHLQTVSPSPIDFATENSATETLFVPVNAALTSALGVALSCLTAVALRTYDDVVRSHGGVRWEQKRDLPASLIPPLKEASVHLLHIQSALTADLTEIFRGLAVDDEPFRQHHTDAAMAQRYHQNAKLRFDMFVAVAVAIIEQTTKRFERHFITVKPSRFNERALLMDIAAFVAVIHAALRRISADIEERNDASGERCCPHDEAHAAYVLPPSLRSALTDIDRRCNALSVEFVIRRRPLAHSLALIQPTIVTAANTADSKYDTDRPFFKLQMAAAKGSSMRQIDLLRGFGADPPLTPTLFDCFDAAAVNDRDNVRLNSTLTDVLQVVARHTQLNIDDFPPLNEDDQQIADTMRQLISKSDGQIAV